MDFFASLSEFLHIFFNSNKLPAHAKRRLSYDSLSHTVIQDAPIELAVVANKFLAQIQRLCSPSAKTILGNRIGQDGRKVARLLFSGRKVRKNAYIFMLCQRRHPIEYLSLIHI